MMGEKILYLEASKKKIQITDKFLDGIFLASKKVLKRVHCGNTCWLCDLQNCQKTISCQTLQTSLFQQHPQRIQEIVAR